MPKTKALTRADRKDQIILCFAVELNGGKIVEKTVADIARLMHLAPSQKLRDMVMELVIDGVLDFRDETIPGVAKYRRLYALKEPNAKRNKQRVTHKRTVKINSKQGSFFEVLS